MFNLIVAVLSIALIGITAGASVYYGGNAFSNSNNRGQVSALISAGGQIAAAQSLHRTEKGGVGATALTTEDDKGLIDLGYLQAQPSVPTGLENAGSWAIAPAGDVAILRIGTGPASATSAAKLVCNKVVEEGGARLVAADPDTGDLYPTDSVLSGVFAGGVDDYAAISEATINLATAVKLEGYNDGRRVNFACLEHTGATYFAYRI